MADADPKSNGFPSAMDDKMVTENNDTLNEPMNVSTGFGLDFPAPQELPVNQIGPQTTPRPKAVMRGRKVYPNANANNGKPAGDLQTQPKATSAPVSPPEKNPPERLTIERRKQLGPQMRELVEFCFNNDRQTDTQMTDTEYEDLAEACTIYQFKEPQVKEMIRDA